MYDVELRLKSLSSLFLENINEGLHCALTVDSDRENFLISLENNF